MVSESKIPCHTKIYLTLLFEKSWSFGNEVTLFVKLTKSRGVLCDYTLSITFKSVSKVHIYLEALHC